MIDWSHNYGICHAQFTHNIGYNYKSFAMQNEQQNKKEKKNVTIY